MSIAVAKQLHAESWYGHIQFDENRVGTFFVDHLLNTDALFWRVAASGNNLIGTIAGFKFRPPLSNHFATFDSFLYVGPFFRDSWLAYRLSQSFRDWSKAAGRSTAALAA
jgi:hypothetical protein